MNGTYDHYTERYSDIINTFTEDNNYYSFLKRFESKELVLLTGFMKSGNTWLRFLIYHYFLLQKEYNSNNSLTFDELNKIQKHSLENKCISSFDPNYPKIIRTHLKYISGFKSFNVLYISRNPLDTIVSKYHYLSKRETPFRSYPLELRNELLNIDNYVLFEIQNWINFHKVYLDNYDLHITYEDLKRSPEKTLKKVVSHLGVSNPQKELLEKSVELSSFNRIKKMSMSNSQQNGMSKTFNGTFTRKGIVGSYKEEIEEKTIEKVLDLLKLNNIKI